MIYCWRTLEESIASQHAAAKESIGIGLNAGP